MAGACNASRAVVSTGGGAIVDPDNYRAMAASGVIICLESTPETISRRLQQSNGNGEAADLRPLLAGPEPIRRIRELKAQRQAYYDLASAHAALQEKDAAIECIGNAVRLGWRNLPELEAAENLASLVTDKRLGEILEEVRRTPPLP